MKFKKKILKNGMRVITVPMPESLTATVLVLVEAGSKYETKDVNGISHFLEHMCFKGTINRPNSGDIHKELDSLGAQTNAFTWYEFTGYYAKAHSKHARKLIDIISDLYLNPVFNEEEIGKEKGVIIEEMNMYKDLPMREVWNVFMNLLYGDQPAGMTILGNEKFIKSVSQKDFLDYRRKHYVASATTIVVAGNFDEKKAIENIEKNFALISQDKKTKKRKVVEKQTYPRLKIQNKKTDQTHLILGTRAFDCYKKDSVVTSVLAGVLGAGMSSRLFHKLREEMGCCYYVRANNHSFTDHGVFAVSAGVDKGRLTEVVGVLLEEMKRLKKEVVSEKELKKVKEYLVGNLFLGLESSDAFADFYGEQEIMKKEILTPKEKAKMIKNVSARDIKRVANKIFRDKNLNLAIIGSVSEKDKKELKRILKLDK